MRILYVNVIEGHAGWGAEHFMNRALQALGHATFCLDYRANRFRLYRRFRNTPPCDAFLLQRAEEFPLPLVRCVRVPRFFWASELVSRCRDQDRLLSSGLFHHVFLRTPACLDAVAERGWLPRERCSILLSGFDEDLHRPIPGLPRDIDVLFVSGITERRGRLLERIGRHFKVVQASAFGEDMVRLFSRAKVVLNIHAEEFPDTETRVYEVLGCGAFLLTERLSSENPFSESDLASFDSEPELLAKLAHYLAHDEERARISERGRNTALAGHTYRHRAQQIAATMSTFAGRGQGEGMETMLPDWRCRAYGLVEPLLRARAGLSWAIGCRVERLRRGIKAGLTGSRSGRAGTQP
jgi:hypothetical protein